jgi:hypothetical protein
MAKVIIKLILQIFFNIFLHKKTLIKSMIRDEQKWILFLYPKKGTAKILFFYQFPNINY